MSDPKILMIHGLFRSGSTALWTAFRDGAATTAYYEPLHELLPLRVADRAAEYNDPSHRGVQDAYFAEYPSPLPGKARALYDRAIRTSFRRRPSAESLASLQEWVEYLVDRAPGDHLVVLKFNRLCLALPEVKAQFGDSARHLAIVRDPSEIARSGNVRREAFSWYYARYANPARVLSASHPVMARMVRRCRPELHRRSVDAIHQTFVADVADLKIPSLHLSSLQKHPEEMLRRTLEDLDISMEHINPSVLRR